MSSPSGGFAAPPEQAARELLRAIRGKISQVALSRRLGYKSNAIAGWEGGHRFPSLGEALRAASACHIDVPASLAAFHARTAHLFRPEDPSAWLDGLRGAATLRDVAKRSGFSEHQIGRWMRGEACPRLPDALVLVEATTGRATDLVAALVPISSVPSLAQTHQARTKIRRLMFLEPWTAGVLTLVGRRQPLPDAERQITSALGIEPEIVRRVLSALLDAGVIASGPDGMRVVAPLTVDTQPSAEDVRALRRHWSLEAAERLGAEDPESRFYYNVFNVSREDLARIQEILGAAFREIRAIIAASPSADATMLYVSHLCSLCPPDPQEITGSR